MDQCIFCSEQMLDKPTQPCAECEERMLHGFTILECVREAPENTDFVKLGEGWFTGNWCVIQLRSAIQIFGEDVAETRHCMVEPETWDKLNLPRQSVNNHEV